MLIKIAIDFVMTVLMVLAMSYRITGNTVHEVLGVIIFVLFFIHNILNRQWYKTIFKNKKNAISIINTVVNLLLVVTMGVLIISSVLISRTVFAFAGLSGGILARQLHILSAYWGFILVSVHIGIHWGLIINATRKMTGIKSTNNFRTIALRVFTVLIAVYGIYISFEKEVGAKLILYYTYDYWDINKSAINYFVEYLSIMGIYICGTYYTFKLINNRKNYDKNISINIK